VGALLSSLAEVGLVELMPSLARFVPSAKVLDKHVYSPWTEERLDAD
jgi:hypothetical protein